MNRGTEQTFSKEDVQKANRYRKRYSISLTLREMQIKTTIRYYLTPVRMAAIKQIRDNKCLQRCGGKETPVHCWWECELMQPLWKTVRRFLKKVKIELPYDPAIPLLGIDLEKAPACHNQRKPQHRNEDPTQQSINQSINL